MKRTKGRRDSDLPLAAKRELYQRSACLCEFEGCSIPLFYDLVSAHSVNNGAFAHIIPSSQNGPRGDQDDGAYDIDSPENRILLCQKHHVLVDDNPKKFSVAKLREMKYAHERKVAAFIVSIRSYAIYPLIFISKIKGVEIDVVDSLVNAAVIDDGHSLLTDRADRIVINCDFTYGSRVYWKRAITKVEREVKIFVDKIRLLGAANNCIAVFPIGPIPLLAKLGAMLINKFNLKVYPKLRHPDCWSWQNASDLNSFNTRRIRKGEGSSKKVALVISVSDSIGSRLLLKLQGAQYPIYEIKARKTMLDAVRSEDELVAFDKRYYSTLNRIQRDCPKVKEIDVYAAVPNTVAFDIGFRRMPSVHPKLNIYENCGEWKYALSIGE